MVHHSWTSSTDSTTILQMVVESVLFLRFSAMICWICPFLLMIFWSNWWFQPPWKIWKSDWIIIPTIGEIIKFHGSKPPTSDGWEAMIWILPWHPLVEFPGSSWYPRDFNSWIQMDTIPVVLKPVFASGTSNRVIDENGSFVDDVFISCQTMLVSMAITNFQRLYLGFLKDPQQIKTSSYRLPTWWITEKASPEYPHYTPKLPSRVNVFSSGTGKSPSWSSVNEA